MAFEQALTATPGAIEDISVALVDYIADEENPARQEAHFEVQVRYSNGEMKTGDLVPHLTPAQITGLMDFVDDMRTKAEEEILP